VRKVGLLRYRKATAADLDWLVATEQQCFGTVEAFSRRSLGGMIKNAHDSIILDILELGQTPVGYAVYLTRRNSKYIRLYSVCLLPDFQGQGLIGAYLRERISQFSGKYQKIGLEVRIGNTGAERLYAKLGFGVKELLKGYYAGGKEDGYRMVKKLVTN